MIISPIIGYYDNFSYSISAIRAKMKAIALYHLQNRDRRLPFQPKNVIALHQIINPVQAIAIYPVGMNLTNYMGIVDVN